MRMHQSCRFVMAALAAAALGERECHAQCCLSDFFAGCGTCFRKQPAYAVAPMMAPVPAPPPPVMVPVQQTSYVPETTYRMQYQTVPVTSYKPSTEIDPCTGCPRDCVQPVTQYVQQAVNVPVTQYRAVTTTKYVQMQPPAAPPPAYGTPAFAAPATYGAPVAFPAPGAMPAPMMPPPSAPAASPFAAPLQTTPQGWGAAGNDVSQQIVPGQTSINSAPIPAVPQSTFQPAIVPQAGGYAPGPTYAPAQPQPTQPPAFAPAPSLKPIPATPRAAPNGGPSGATPGAAATVVPAPALPSRPPFGSAPMPAAAATGAAGIAGPSAGPAPGPSATGTNGAAPAGGAGGMPVIPGGGPGSATGAFPRLLEPTSHTTWWQPNVPGTRMATSSAVGYPTSALPGRLQQ